MYVFLFFNPEISGDVCNVSWELFLITFVAFTGKRVFFNSPSATCILVHNEV